MRMMNALVYDAPGKGSVRQIPYPACGDSQVVIKVMAAGICKWAEIGHDTNGTGLAKYPVVPGHEFSGYVEEVGRGVSSVRVGARVTADNTVLCGTCYECQHDNSLYCENFGSLGHNINGGFAQYVVVEASKVFAIPDHINFDDATIAEPVACAVHAMKILKPKLGDNVLVTGMGPHGLILAQLAHHSEAGMAAAIGLRQDRLDWLADYGVPTILASRDDDTVHEAAIARMFPHGVDAVIDSAGSWPMVKSLFKFLRKGGKYLQYGSFHSAGDLDITTGMLNQLHYREQQYISCSAQTYCFPQAIEYIANGKVRLDHLVSHVFPLDDYFKALEVNKSDKTAVKVIIHPNGEPD